MSSNTKAPLPEHFDAEDHGKAWYLFCKVCGKGWSLDKRKASQPGVGLRLLNHARSHKANGRHKPSEVLA